jgi:hypothetical protein
MNNEPYFCPNCRSNRVKFSLITTHTQAFMKNAHDGSITEMADDQFLPSLEPEIQCRVCSFVGNELRFIKQAEKEPRMM